MKVLIITGPAGAVQGWGDMQTTESICNAIKSSGKDAEILYVENVADLLRGLNSIKYDIVWSALYHITNNPDYISLASGNPWVADILDECDIPYVGPNATTMKQLIDKSATLGILAKAYVPVPIQYVVDIGNTIRGDNYPVIVKPCCESESAGISEKSVVHSDEEMRERIKYIHETFCQSALVEEYLPGSEITVALIGNDEDRQVLPVLNVIDPFAYEKYPLITIDLKIKDLISFEILCAKDKEAKKLAVEVADILGCYDHIRIDMREDAMGELKIIEVNGIPGLNPIKSRSLQIHALNNPGLSKKDNFNMLINTIVDSALDRHGIYKLGVNKGRLYNWNSAI